MSPVNLVEAFDGYAVADLRETFSKYENKSNWKLPFRAAVDHAELSKLIRAALFFAGSPVKVERIDGFGAECVFHVYVPGYYASVGA